MGLFSSVKEKVEDVFDDVGDAIGSVSDALGISSGSGIIKAIGSGGVSSLLGVANKGLEQAGKNIIDPLLGSPVAKAQERAKQLEREAKAQSEQARRERIGLAASRALGIEEQIAERKRNSVGSASTILSGQTGPAIRR